MSEVNSNRVNEVLPFGKMTALGLQHVLAFYSGGVAIPLIVGSAIGMSPEQIALLVSADLFTCGIATIIQSFGLGNLFGIKLPVILGYAFAPMAVMITIGNNLGPAAIYGSVIGAGLFMMLMAPFFGMVLKFFPPVVTGTVVAVVGLSLIPVSLHDIAGGMGSPTYGNIENVLLGIFTLAAIVVLNKYTKGFLRSISILLGLIIGTIVAGFMGMVDLSIVANARWFQFVRPFAFGTPVFNLQGILPMCVTMLVVMIESTGTFFVIGKYCDKQIEDKDVTRGLRAEGVATILGGIFNSFPYTTYSGNAGLVGLTKISSRFVVVTAGIILVLLGLFPKFAALATIIPPPVLGAVMLIMFSMVVTAGIEILQEVDLSKNENVLTVAISIGAGLGVTVVPDVFKSAPELLKTLCQNGVVIGSVLAVLLNIFFNHIGKKDVSNKETLTH
jgi:xanthine permease